MNILSKFQCGFRKGFSAQHCLIYMIGKWKKSLDNKRAAGIFLTNNIRTEHYGKESLSFLGPIIWSIIPHDIKTSTSLKDFKQKIRKWKPDKCPCKLCRTFIVGVGYID